MKKMVWVLLLIAFAVFSQEAAAYHREWKGMPASKGNTPMLYFLEFTAPIFPLDEIIADPEGDDVNTTPRVDVISVQSGTDGVMVPFRILFSRETSMANVVGLLELDLDQNGKTGTPPSANYFLGASQDIKVEVMVDCFGVHETGEVQLFKTTTGDFLGSVPATINEDDHALEFSVPLSMLGDDGFMNVGGVFGNFDQPTDAVPDAGHGTISGVGRVTITPGSSSLFTTQTLDLGFVFFTRKNKISKVEVILDGEDVTKKVVGAVVLGMIPSMDTGHDFTARIPGVNVGKLFQEKYGWHTLQITVYTEKGQYGDKVDYLYVPNNEPFVP